MGHQENPLPGFHCPAHHQVRLLSMEAGRGPDLLVACPRVGSCLAPQFFSWETGLQAAAQQDRKLWKVSFFRVLGVEVACIFCLRLTARLFFFLCPNWSKEVVTMDPQFQSRKKLQKWSKTSLLLQWWPCLTMRCGQYPWHPFSAFQGAGLALSSEETHISAEC